VVVVAALLLATLAMSGVPWPVVVLTTLGAVQPFVALGVVAVLGVGARLRRGPGGNRTDEAVYHGAVAAELRRGASLRTAMVHAGSRVPGLDIGHVGRLLRTGQPISVVAAALQPALPLTGRLAMPAITLAAESGGRAAAVFDRLASRALADAEAARERHAATAQARLSAWIVGGLPVGAVVVAAASGRLGRVAATGTLGLAVLVIGMVLVGLGLATVVILVRRGAP